MKSEWTRREVLSAGVGTAAAATSGEVLAESPALPARTAGSSGRKPHRQTVEDGFAQPGEPSREAYRALAEAERDHQLRVRDRFAQEDGPDGDDDGEGGGGGQPTAPSFARTVNAVEDLGADPTGSRPINGDVGPAIGDGTLVVFPPGDYVVEGKWQINVDGTFGMAGAGYQSNSPPTSGEAASLVAPSGTPARINFGATTGLFANFVLNQSRNNASIGIVLNSHGFVHGRDLVVTGIVDDTGSAADEAQGHSLVAFLSDPGTTARMTRLVARWTGYPGDKNVGGVPAMWVGRTNRGTAQIVNCRVRGCVDNGIYGSRTPGDTHIVGGSYINNEVAQIRYCGRGSFADGVTITIDADNYRGPVGETGGFIQKIATNGVKIEQPSHIDKPGGAVLRNADIRGLSGRNVGALVFVRGHGGGLKIDNCRVANALPTAASVRASRPGSSYDPASPPPHNITITYSLFTGPPSLEDVVNIDSREQSLVTNTCFRIPGFAPTMLSGIQVGSGVGFGESCSAGGLRAPDAVGAGGNLSAVNFSAMNASVASIRPRGGKTGGIVTAIVSTVFILIGGLVGVGMAVLALAALASVGLAVVSYVVIDE
jgi:hypothetical protein